METSSYLNRAKQFQVPQSNDKKHIIVGLIIATILVAVFFTQGVVEDYVAADNEITTHTEELKSLKVTLSDISAIETKLLNDRQALEDVKKYASSFREDEILSAIFEPNMAGSIQGVTVDKGQKMPNGLSLANISLSLSVSTKEQLMAYLQYLTDIKNPRRFVIKSVNYPFTSGAEGGDISLQLGMYYFAK